MQTPEGSLAHAAEQAERGADTLAASCLQLRPGETVWLGSWSADTIAPMVARALQRAGAVVKLCALDRFRDATDERAALNEVSATLRGCSASVLIAGGGLQSGLSIGIIKAAGVARTRHIHMPRMDTRVLGSSVRADPDVLRQINARIEERLRRATTVRVTSGAGTEMRLGLDPRLPIVADCGRPEPAQWDNLPTGFVYFHPVSAEGTYIADRVALTGAGEADAAHLRRSPLRVVLVRGAVQSFECADDSIRALFETYLGSHSEARRVGFASIPTNYLARTELQHSTHDSLLPGIKLHLGYPDRARTGATYDAAVQFRLTGRRQSVRAGDTAIVTTGRLERALVEGLDPFR